MLSSKYHSIIGCRITAVNLNTDHQRLTQIKKEAGNNLYKVFFVIVCNLCMVNKYLIKI